MRTDLNLDAIKALTIIEWEDDDGEIFPLVCMDPDDRDALVAEVERLRAVADAVIDAIAEEAADQLLVHKGESIKRLSLTPRLLEALSALHPQEPSDD